MHAASPTYTPVFLRTVVAALFVLLFFPAGAADDHTLALPADSGHYEAGASWRPRAEPADERQEAVLRWTQIDDEVVAFSARTLDGDMYVCHGTNGTVQSRNGTHTEGRCSVGREAPTTFVFVEGGNNKTWEGRPTTNITTFATFETTEGSPSPLLGSIVTFLALVFFASTVALAFLYVRERRMAHYLVRRLYEETKGRMPTDWPENMRQQWIARIFIRGKN